MLKVIGLKVEMFLNTMIEGHNCDFRYFKDEDKKYTLFVRTVEHRSKLFAIRLKNTYGECGSGWTTASYGHMEVEKIDHTGPFNYAPLKEILLDDSIEYRDGEYVYVCDSPVEDDFYDGEHIVNSVFSYSDCGHDCYYPDGGVSVNMKLFKPLKRNMEARPVFIFHGPSGLGKSTLADALKDMEVYETDSAPILPEVITAQVVVIGNKESFPVSAVKKRLFGSPKVIEVEFS